MDHGSQNYHSLSHALHPPSIRPTDAYANTGYPPSAYQTNSAGSAQKRANVEEEEDEEDEAVEDATGTSSHGGSGHPQSATSTSGQDAFIHHPASSSATQGDGQPEKRRPGRPKGSKTRKPRDSPTASKQPKYPTPSTAPSIPGMPAQNQQYYEFQWRVLNLCSEFYGAAEELIKGTPPAIIQQTYQHGPVAKVNPMEMLNEARRICDDLLANPQHLVGRAPPAVYNPYSAPSAPAPSAPPAASGSKPPSYGIPLQPAYYPPGPAYPGYTGAYYPYPYPATYSMPPPSATASKHEAPVSAPLPTSRQPTPSSAPIPTQTPHSVPITPASVSTSAPPPASAGASGTWAEDEIEKLKRLAEQSKSTNNMGDVNWDWVVQSWGPSRSRHQILLKSTSLGLKESTTRPNQKRKREDTTGEPELRPAPAPPTAQQPSLALPPPQTLSGPGSAQAPPQMSGPPQMTGPAQNSNTSSPATRPASGSAMRPLSATTVTRPASGSVSASNPPWPMPVIASGASPVNIQVSPRQDARLPPVNTAATGAYSFPGGRAPLTTRYAVFPSSQGAQGGADGR